MSVVLDACALIAFLVNEEGADRIADLLINDDRYIHAANVYEVYYDMLERSSEQAANDMLSALTEMGINVVCDMKQSLIKGAALTRHRLKQQGHRMAMADYFAVALAVQYGFSVVTSDHKEFKPVSDLGICEVEFFRGPKVHLQ